MSFVLEIFVPEREKNGSTQQILSNDTLRQVIPILSRFPNLAHVFLGGVEIFADVDMSPPTGWRRRSRKKPKLCLKVRRISSSLRDF